MKPYLWTEYSEACVERILSPRNLGIFEENAEAFQDMRVVRGEEIQGGSQVLFSIIVDIADGTIADAKFLAFGKTALIAVADTACELLLRKTYIQAKRLTGERIDQKLRDFAHIPAFPKEVYFEVNLVLSAIQIAMDQCSDLPASTLIESPLREEMREREGGDPNWHVLSREEKLDQIQAIIEVEIQPSIALDAGGIRVIAFHDEREVMIAYEGACTTCPSSTGATLEAIQSILRSRLSPTLCVKADPSFLDFGSI